ncbi:MAG: phosphoribosylanthranilate isomerase [Pyrinomonadaceae bacterium]
MTKVKICGITNLADALLATDLGADMLGFNFFSGSRRFIGKRASHITKGLPDAVRKVGIFVNQEITEIVEAVETAGLDLVQLHGEETPDFVAELGCHISSDLIKAFRVGPGFDTGSVRDYPVEYVLFDSLSVTGDRGGTGESFDWTIANSLSVSSKVLFLAGGLNPLNVAEAVRQVCPFAVDVASGVESVPGKKDPEKMAAFIKNAKNAL